MSERTITITVTEGKYEIENAGISEFEMIGILECIAFEMKSAKRSDVSSAPVPTPVQTETATPAPKEVAPIEVVSEQPVVSIVDNATKLNEGFTPKEEVLGEKTLALRTRIGNALRAITDLGGETSEIEFTGLTDEELQTELDDLTEQYKRLKKSKGK